LISRVSDGIVYANFSRSLSTGDSTEDVDLDGTQQCYHLLYLHPGGPIDPATNDIGKHSESPPASEKRACFGRCGLTASQPWEESSEVESSETAATSPASEERHVPTTIVETSVDTNRVVEEPVVVKQAKGPMTFSYRMSYDLAVRLPNETWSPHLTEANSTEFQQLAGKLQASLREHFARKWPRTFKEVGFGVF